MTCVPVFKVKLFATGDVDGRLGWVIHGSTEGLRFLSLRQFIISTGPVWFGSLVVSGTKITMSGGFDIQNGVLRFAQNVPSGFAAYVCRMLESIPDLLFLHLNVDRIAVRHMAGLYLIFCISSEMKLSGADLKGVWKFLIETAVFVMLVHLMPVASKIMMDVFETFLPFVFCTHMVMLFALIAGMMFLGVHIAAVETLNRIVKPPD